ncbi:MAG: hypothetical protein K9H49_05775 [Bacteroidales bacterium]|nr:hypothetical protein [Bacteroidales bacterium]MCF8404383.1 hypothetical protein [Bacteroidales bacterium]
MKKSTMILLLLAITGIFVSGCKKEDDNPDPNNNNNTSLPDAVFNMTVSGAESHTFSFTLPENVASNYAVNGAHQSSVPILSILASSLPITWQYGLIADVNSMATGTYNIKEGMSAFTPPSQTTGYLAVSGTLTITKASLYQSVSSIEDWFIDGTFSGTYQDNNTPPNEVTITGSFSGVNIKAQ